MYMEKNRLEMHICDQALAYVHYVNDGRLTARKTLAMQLPVIRYIFIQSFNLIFLFKTQIFESIVFIFRRLSAS